jgi:hypothetical protein
MHRTLLSALAAVTIMSSGAAATGAKDVAASANPALAIRHTSLVRVAGVVCGNNGCAPAQTSAPRRRRFVPLGHG